MRETSEDCYTSGLYSWVNREPFTVMENSGRESSSERKIRRFGFDLVYFDISMSYLRGITRWHLDRQVCS